MPGTRGWRYGGGGWGEEGGRESEEEGERIFVKKMFFFENIEISTQLDRGSEQEKKESVWGGGGVEGRKWGRSRLERESF